MLHEVGPAGIAVVGHARTQGAAHDALEHLGDLLVLVGRRAEGPYLPPARKGGGKG